MGVRNGRSPLRSTSLPYPLGQLRGGDVNHDSNSWRESDWLVSARNARVRGVRGEEGKPKKGSFLSYAEGWGGWDGLFFLSFDHS